MNSIGTNTRGHVRYGTVTVMKGDLNAVWKAVRDVLGTAAKDLCAGAAAKPAQAAQGVTKAVAGAVEADVAHLPALAAANSELVSGMTFTATSSTYILGRDLIDKVDYSALRRTGGAKSLGRSPIFEKIQGLQGFTGSPTVATSHEVDAVIAAGGHELFRGFDEDRHVDAFISGPVRPGGGTTRSGTYISPLADVAFHYTDPART